jgi:hypothetical protein
MDEIIRILQMGGINKVGSYPDMVYANVMQHTTSQLNELSDFFMKGGAGHIH